MIEILTIGGSVILGISSIIFLVIYIKAFNNFLRVFRETHQQKWTEFGRLQSIRLEFQNKRTRANIDRWIKKEADEKYDDLRIIYLSVSRLESITVILIVISVFFLLVHFVFSGEL